MTTTITQRVTKSAIAIPPSIVAAERHDVINPTAGTTTHSKGDFTWSTTDEPHATRRKLILAAHPEIAELFGPEPLTFLVVLFELALQFTVAYFMRDQSWLTIFICSYVIGGTINHSLQLASHELSHNLCWSSCTANKLTAILCNLPTGLPSAITFQRYHMDHHQFQGVDGIDTDIPCEFEVNYVTNVVLKIVWLICQPLAYALRPMFIKPKPMGKWEVINWIACISFDLFFYFTFGWKSMAYLLMGTFLGLGLHPSAGHFIAEHYEFIMDQETYSYYGPWNLTNFNVGYHNEHHDFPRIPWTRLPKVKQIAPEFYDILPSYTSYLYVFWRFIVDPEIGVFSRIKRQTTVEKRQCMDASTDKSQYKIFRCVVVSCMAGVVGLTAAGAFFM